VALQLTLFVAALAVGLALQLAGADDSVRERAWVANFWVLSPLVVLVTFLRLDLDSGLVRALGASIVASWLVIAASFAYAYAVTRSRDERGALVLGGSFGNTAFLGYALAQLAFGPAGFTLAVLYDRLALLFPMTSISTVISRFHGRKTVDVAADRRLRAIVLNPPAWALLVAVSLRLAGVHPQLDSVSHALAYAVGAYGFFLLGLALPLHRIEHDAAELGRAAGVLVIRFALSPLLLLLCGRIAGAQIPSTFYLMAAMPVAFHLLVLARVYDLRPALVRLMVVGSTVPGVVAVVVGAALRR
jgi:predicted permease